MGNEAYKKMLEREELINKTIEAEFDGVELACIVGDLIDLRQQLDKAKAEIARLTAPRNHTDYFAYEREYNKLKATKDATIAGLRGALEKAKQEYNNADSMNDGVELMLDTITKALASTPPESKPFVAYFCGAKQCDEVLVNLKRVIETKPENPCEWKYDEEHEKYDTSCGSAWSFIDEGIEENGVKFCHRCGKPVVEEKGLEDEV